MYRALADAVVVAHLAFVAFVVLGALLVPRRPWVAWIHLPAAAWGAAVELAGCICPLTPLESWLRSRGGGPIYGGDIVEHYVLPLLYPAALTRSLQVALGVVVLMFNLVLYGRLLARWARG